jgi:hypothetical protein
MAHTSAVWNEELKAVAVTVMGVGSSQLLATVRFFHRNLDP